MRTPAGKECGFFYGDYYRGRNHEECRLLTAATPPLYWSSDLCQTCPVPDVLLANACPHMILIPRIERRLPLLKKQVQVRTYCTSTQRERFDPHIGCGKCHQLPLEFTGEKQ